MLFIDNLKWNYLDIIYILILKIYSRTKTSLINVHVISRKILRDYCQSHTDVCDALYDWYRVASKAQWKNLTQVQATYKTAEAVGNFTVFKI